MQGDRTIVYKILGGSRSKIITDITISVNSPEEMARDARNAVDRGYDALKIMQMGAADMVNIKLMKCGGLYNALKIVSAAEVYGVECMIGCMLEAKISVNAAVHLVCAKQIIAKIDLDGPVLCSEAPILGGAVFNEREITVSNDPGLGIHGIQGIRYLVD